LEFTLRRAERQWVNRSEPTAIETNTGARDEIIVDGMTRTHPDDRKFAFEAAALLRSKASGRRVVVKESSTHRARATRRSRCYGNKAKTPTDKAGLSKRGVTPQNLDQVSAVVE